MTRSSDYGSWRGYHSYTERKVRVIAERLLSVQQVADMLNVSPETVKRYARSGELDSVRLGYHTIRFRPDAVAAFVVARERRQRRPPPPSGRS